MARMTSAKKNLLLTLYTYADAVQICGKFWNTLHIRSFTAAYAPMHEDKIQAINYTDTFLLTTAGLLKPGASGPDPGVFGRIQGLFGRIQSHS